jgi:hypothetical protein
MLTGAGQANHQLGTAVSFIAVQKPDDREVAGAQQIAEDIDFR